MGVMGTALTYYHSSLLARGTLTCATRHVRLLHHDSLLQSDFFPLGTQREETDPGKLNVGFQGTLYLVDREYQVHLFFCTAKERAVGNQLQGTANLFTL